MFVPLSLLVFCLSSAFLGAESNNATSPSGLQVCVPDMFTVLTLREMRRTLVDQSAEIKRLRGDTEAKMNELEMLKSEVEKLKQQQQANHVAFTASLVASGAATIGPFSAFTNLVFRRIITNIGNAYNHNTGVFTAPLRGAYHFEFYVGGHGYRTHPSSAMLVKNDQHICNVYQRDSSHYETSANGATLLLQVGDVVFLRLWPYAILYDNVNNHNTFSGFLLFTM